MTNRVLTRGCILLLALSAATVIVAQEPSAPAVQLSKGELILVMRARDYTAGGRVIDGTGAALVQSVHNALAELDLSPQPGSYAAIVNALEECERLGCTYLLLPRLERYLPRRAMRAKVRVTLDLIDAASGSVIASCDESEIGGKQSQELLRPAVDGCLGKLIGVESDTTRPVTAETGQFLVVPFRDLWVLQRNEKPQENDSLIDLLLESMREADYRVERGPSGVKRKELFAHARKMECNRILTVGVGLVWTSREQPPDDAPPQLVVSLVDVASEETLQTIIVESADRRWTSEDSELLPLLVQTAMGRLLGRPDLSGTVPDGVKLSLLEPATIIENSHAKVPRASRHKLLQAEVLVSFVVDEQGKVIDPLIVESTPELDKVVLKAVKRLRFLPARRDGEVCPIHLALRYFIDQTW